MIDWGKGGGVGGGGPNFGSERTVELFYGKLLLPPPHTPSLQLRLYVIIPWPLTVYLICTRNASVNSSCGQSPPPRLLRDIYPPCQSQGWSIWKKLWKFEGKNCSCIGAPRGRPPPTSPQFHQEMCLDW